MKPNPAIIAALITGLCVLGAAYISSSPKSIYMEGNLQVPQPPRDNAIAISNDGNATSINNVSNISMNQQVTAGYGATVTQSSSNDGGSEIIINGKFIKTH